MAVLSGAAAAKVAAWRERGFRDPGGELKALDWGDPIERLGAVSYMVTYETPETVMSVYHGGAEQRAKLEKVWLGMRPSDRQLWRRRAETSIVVAAAPPVGA